MTFRFGRQPAPDHPPLVWEVFFSTKTPDPIAVKYPLSQLIAMDHDELKAVIDEYFVRVYCQTALGQDVSRADVYNSDLLAQLGLPPYADMAEMRLSSAFAPWQSNTILITGARVSASLNWSPRTNASGTRHPSATTVALLRDITRRGHRRSATAGARARSPRRRDTGRPPPARSRGHAPRTPRMQ